MADSLPLPNPDRILTADEDERERAEKDPTTITKILDTYKNEAEHARKSGPSPRDVIWEANWDRYWGRYDHSKKAAWQSTHVMPESPQFVDRWAAAMREALDSGGQWFSAVDPTGRRNDLAPHIEKLMSIVLGRCATTPDGHRADFSSVFEDQMKMGALMMCSAAVTWKSDDSPTGGWVSVDSVDPREVWLDPTMRNVYRRRSYMIDHHELLGLAKELDDAGESLYDVDAIMELSAAVLEQKQEKERASGHGQEESSHRKPVKIDEWLCTLVSPEGDVIGDNQLVIVGNDTKVIRGPEPNPFWHNQDWIVTTAMVPVPFSAYGRSYMEDWADVADAFIDLTNLILDGTFTTTLKAFAVLPEFMEDPTALDEGISPNMVVKLAEGLPDVKTFLKEIELGELPATSINIWTALKQELRDGAKLSEIALGQMAPNQGTTATEITTVTQNGSAVIRSMARTIESRFLEPLLTIVWQTALQHMDFIALAPELGEETAQMLQGQRDEFRDLNIKFRVRGISSLVDRQTELRNLLSMLQVVGQNEVLLQTLLQKADPGKIMDRLFQLFGVDPNDFELTDQERRIRQISQGEAMQPGQEAAPQGAEGLL